MTKLDEKILSVVEISEDRETYSDTAQRPESFSDFIGQKDCVDQLRVFLQGARARGVITEHILFSGPPGLGKTSLAQLVAFEQKTELKTVMAPTLNKIGDLIAILVGLEKGDVLFIDEIHRLNVACTEMLYGAMEDGRVDIAVGEGDSAKICRIDLKPFSLVGATTRPGMLSQPLYARFGLHLRLDFYNDKDLCSIVKRSASLFGIQGEEDAYLSIAQAGRGTPRIAKRLLRRVLDYAIEEKVSILTKAHVLKTLDILKIEPDGLDDYDRRYLEILVRYKDKPVGLKTLATSMFESLDLLENFVEPFLMGKGLIERTSSGRKITEIGKKRFLEFKKI